MHPHPPQGHARRADPARARSRRRRSRLTFAPGLRGGARGSASTRAELDAANAKGKLKAALQRAFKTNDVAVPADLGERTEQALRQTALDRLGMEARAGNLINGSDRVETAARSGKVQLLIHAADAGEDGNRSARPGVAGRRRRARRGDIPRGAHYLVHGTWARECGTCRPDRSRRRFACPPRACERGGLSLAPIVVRKAENPP